MTGAAAIPPLQPPPPTLGAPSVTARPRRTWKDRLRYINPLRIFFGAVFQRDVSIIGRRPSTYWIRCAFVAALLGIACIGIFGTIFGTQYDTGPRRVEQMQNLAPGLTMFVLWLQFFMLNLFAPTLAAPAFTDERTRRTLSTLATSPLTPLEIVGGKLASRLLSLGILALIPVPLLLALRLFGGLDAVTILQCTAVTLSSAVMMATIALLFSTLFSRPANATAFAMMTGVFVNLIPLLVMAFASLITRLTGTAAIMSWFTGSSVVSPGFAHAAAMQRLLGGGMPLSSMLWVYNIAVTSGISILCVGLTAAVLPSLFRRDAVGATTSKKSRKSRRAKIPDVTPEPSTPAEAGTPTRVNDRRTAPVRIPGLSRVVSDRPIYWRESRQVSGRSLVMRWLIGMVMVFLAGYFYIWQGPDRVETVMTIGIALLIAVCAIGVNASTSSIVGEVEARTWDVLISSPISPWTIILSKTLAALRRLWYLPTLMLAHLLICAFFGGVHPLGLLMIVPLVISLLFFMCACGVLMSLLARKASAASSNNLLVCLSIWLILPIGVGITASFLNLGGSVMRPLAEYLFPITNAPTTIGTTLFAAAEAAREGRWDQGVAFGHGLPGLCALVLLNFLFTVGAGLLCLLLARRVFNRASIRMLK